MEAINSTAIRLFESGVASVEDIDRAFMIVQGVPRDLSLSWIMSWS
jgi:3-hydroxyacyl-CoA dehydrogenase